MNVQLFIKSCDDKVTRGNRVNLTALVTVMTQEFCPLFPEIGQFSLESGAQLDSHFGERRCLPEHILLFPN